MAGSKLGRCAGARTSNLVTQVGMVKTDDGAFGASADSFIGEDGGSEYKCFLSPEKLRAFHIDNDASDVIDQVQGCMWITGRKWWHIGMYCPLLKYVGRQLWLQSSSGLTTTSNNSKQTSGSSSCWWTATCGIQRGYRWPGKRTERVEISKSDQYGPTTVCSTPALLLPDFTGTIFKTLVPDKPSSLSPAFLPFR